MDVSSPYTLDVWTEMALVIAPLSYSVVVPVVTVPCTVAKPGIRNFFFIKKITDSNYRIGVF